MQLKRIVNYDQAFSLIDAPMTERVKFILKKLEQEGHTQRGICYAIWREQEKLLSFRRDNRFCSILENAIRKWSWPKNDKRWVSYHQMSR